MHDGQGRSEVDGIALPGGLDTTLAAIEAVGGSGLAVRMDLLDRATITDGLAVIIDRLGPIDVLVNNAIYQGRGTIVNMISATA